MILAPADVGIILSYRCQSACQPCLSSCGADGHDWMSPEQLCDALQAGRYPPLAESPTQSGPFGLFQRACESYDYEPLSEGYAEAI